MNKIKKPTGLITALFVGFIQLAMFPSVAFAACTHAVGDIVKMLSSEVVAEQMSKVILVKDEYETTAEFNARQKTALGQIPNGTMIVEVINEVSANYNADTEKISIEIPSSLWNIRGSFSYSVPSVAHGESSKTHAIGLKVEDKITGEYPASNAYGKEVGVKRYRRNIYGIFDRKRKINESTTWVSNTFSIPVPRSQAKALKSELRFGIEFTPKEPFIFKGGNYIKATIYEPREILAQIRSISGDIECLVVTDASGTILKVVETAY